MKSWRSAVLLLGLALVACAVAHTAEAASKVSFQLTDVRDLVRLSQPQIAPDGRHIALIVTHADWKTDKNEPRIELVDVASDKTRVLTWHRKGIAALQWSHDGTRLAFLAEAAAPVAAKAGGGAADEAAAGKDAKPKPQVFVMPMDGGDPRQITQTPRGVAGFAWSPHDTRIAFITEDAPANAKALAHHDGAFEVTDGNFELRNALAPWHLWVVASGGGKATRLTEGRYSLQTDRQGTPYPAWSADGKQIAFIRYPGPYWGPSFHSVVDVVDTTGGGPHTLSDQQGAMAVQYAPGSSARYAYLRPRNGDENNGNAVYVGEAGHDRDVTADLARNIDTYAWMPDGHSLLLSGELGTRSVLWLQPLHGKARVLDLGEVNVEDQPSVARDGAIAFIGSTSTHPDELYVLRHAGAPPRRLTDLNAFVDQRLLGRTQSIAWDGPDGFHEDGVLVYPVHYAAGRRYPLVLVIHGGPEGASTVVFSPLTQLLSAAGFLVFEPNYRGSTNLGDAYQHAIFRDTGEGPGQDVMAGLAAVEKLGIVDTNRIGVSGWSYGGYMTAWLSGHYDVWKAAVAGAALTDWVMDYTIAYYQTGDTYFFGGSPWVAKYHDIWRAQSPIAYAQNVKAPTLIMGDVGDGNVPLVNSYEWYHALRDNGVTVRFYAYPVDTHFPEDIVQTTDVYRRWVDWMKRYLQ
ncbi:S9 family peptidase [Metallibacterium sp.]|uniref:S9 family peptidase n=1 Tax=Metallibacterium sp. TaxID=2940281 RepID=UPI00262ADBF4|nr:S9 family peptidase [Metallibacterium sp.]